MKIDASLYLLIVSIRFLLIVDGNQSVTSTTSNRQICTQVRSMLSYGKYLTSQMSSNVTFIPRVYAQNFLAYSSLDNVLIFIEPKHRLHVYDIPTVRLIVNLTISNVVFATSCPSITSDYLHELYFISESRLETKMISIRACQVRFSRIKLDFDEIKCIETLKIPCQASDIRINGFTIKHIGLIYAIFDTTTGAIIREPIILNDTANEGSVVVTSSGIVYYANKKEHTIHELLVTRDFRVRPGKIIKSNAIKSPFGLIADECDHLFIAAKSMILVMHIDKYLTIRSVFSKPSDLPISIERLNATTYVYPTVKRFSNKNSSIWLFNFLSFNEPDQITTATPKPAVPKRNRKRLKKKKTDPNEVSPLLLTTATMISEHVSTEYSSNSISSDEEKNTSDEYYDTTLTDNQIQSTTQTFIENIYTTIHRSEQSSSDTERITFSPQSSTPPLSTTMNVILNETFDNTESVSHVYTPAVDTTTAEEIDQEKSTEYLLEVISTTNALGIISSTIDSIATSYEPSTLVVETTTLALDLHNERNTIQSLTVEVTSYSSETTLKTISENVHLPTLSDQSTSQMNDVIIPINPSEISHTESTMIADSTMNSSSEKMTNDEITQTYSSSILVEVDLPSTLYSPSPFESSSTDPIFSSSSSQSPRELSSSLAQSSITSTKLNRLLSSKHFSETTSIGSVTTSDTTEQSSMTTFVDESSSLSTSFIDTISSESTSIEYETFSTAIHSTAMFDSTTTSPTDGLSTILFQITTDSPFTETTSSISTTDTDEVSTEYTSTVFPDVFTSKIESSTIRVTAPSPKAPSQRPSRRRTTMSTTTTTTDSSRQQKITRPELSTTTPTMTTFYPKLSASSPTYLWYPKFDSLKPNQQTIMIKPSLNSSTLLSSELLQTLFNSTNNSSDEKSIYFNLVDLPPSSWNVSLHTNESILLGIILPSPSNPLTPNSITNLSIINVEANRFSTSIVGSPVNLQVDQIHTKQFSLTMNSTHDQSSRSGSDVIIGRIISEKFQLNITKSDHINLRVQQVDSETADLYFDSQFCSNESNLQINLNLSKNGAVHYGDRAPLRVGPVFTRLYMLKQSCHLDPPFGLFFDICQGQNPCINGGTCQSKIPDYDDPSFSHQDASQVSYKCLCPARTAGEHCQYLQYPVRFCINGGTLLSSLDSNNETMETCSCPPGFRGEHCEENIDDCHEIQCSNHGICQDGIQTYTCSCYGGFYGSQCEQKTVETVLLQVASKSFATIAILVIVGIASLVVASDIHAYVTRREKKSNGFTKKSRATSEGFENSVLLLAFGDAPIELSDLSTVNQPPKPPVVQRPVKKTKTKLRYHPLLQRKYIRTLERPPSGSRFSFYDAFL